MADTAQDQSDASWAPIVNHELLSDESWNLGQ